MRVTKVKNLMLSGYSEVINKEIKKEGEPSKIEKLWGNYEEKGIYAKTFNKANSTAIYCLYSEHNDEQNDYKVTIAVEVTKPKNAIIIKDERYLVFKFKGEFPEVVEKSWNEVLDYFENNSEYERKFAIDFEKFISENELEIYISIV